AWRRALRRGLNEGTALKPQAVTPRIQDVPTRAPQGDSGEGLEIVFRPDPTIWDGRFANNGWLQELPKPMNQLTWDNAALISPALANRLGVADGDLLELRYRGRTARIPAWVMPG